MHGRDELADLDAVGADVLDGCSARLTGNQREVFEALQAVIERPVDERVPFEPGIDVHERVLAVVVHDAGRIALQVNQAAFEPVGGEEHVAACAQHHQRQVLQCRVGQQGRQRRCIVHSGQAMGARVQMKRVPVAQ